MKVEQWQWSDAGGWDARPLADSLADPLASTLGASAQLVLLFGGAKLASAREGIAKARQAFPKARIFGCSTGGEIHGTGVGDGTLTLTAIAFDHSHVATAQAPIESADRSFAAGERLVRGLDARGLRHVFVLSEGLRVNGSDLVSGIHAALPPGVSASGGFAADGNSLQQTHVWCDGEPEQAAAIALGFYGEQLRFGLSVTGGWRPFGPDRVITKSHNNVLYEFDGRPALALYKQYLGDHAAGLPATGLTFPLELCIGQRKHRVLRALLAVDEKEQSITYAGNVPEGSYARFMMGHIEDLIGGALKAAKVSLENLGQPSALSLLVSCNARRAVLKQRVEEEVEAVHDVLGAQTALTGFYSYGEIGPPEAGAPPELHNETMSITSIAEG
jgi:hypothetical protein